MKPVTLALFAGLALASCVQTRPDEGAGRPPAPCDEQLTRAVEARLPNLGQPVDPRTLSCIGLTQVYFLVTETAPAPRDRLLRDQRIRQVFRNEGLID